jgi:hypothetical protein
MATLFDGSRVATMVAGNTALASDQNTIQDKCILGFEGRPWVLPLCAGINNNAAGAVGTWTYDGAADRWTDVTHTTGGLLWLPIHLPSSAYVTNIDVWIEGDAAATGGSIDFYERPAAGSGGGALDNIATGNPWQTGGVPSITKYSAAGLTRTLDSAKEYSIRFTNATGSIPDTFVYGAAVTARFHVGT